MMAATLFDVAAIALPPARPQYTPVVFDVLGVPAPKGSTKAFYVARLGRAVVTEDNTRTRPWAALVRDAASEAVAALGCTGVYFPRGVAIALTVEFVLPRPASLPKRVTHHTKKPDLDKLARALKDACTGVVWQDDSQVIALVASKRYATRDERAGCHVTAVQA